MSVTPGAATSTSSASSSASTLGSSDGAPGGDTVDTASGQQPGATADTSNAAAPAADACSLLTPGDIATATGTAFGDPQAETPQQTQYGAYTACTWLDAESPLTSVRVTVWDRAEAFDDAKTQVGDAVDATGIGDRGFTSGLAAVYAVANGHTVFVQYSNFDNDDETNLPISEALAKVAVGNL
ncbi:MAG: hypothetical protein JWM12_2559 [Ilumatobacteraceae bacterium]|nr:hypothetical protein [Ilumatobacteraceae bacterium]